jgi:hypothetical protein
MPLRPERVVEVRYDRMEGERFATQRSSTAGGPTVTHAHVHEQLEQPVTFNLGDIVPGLG